MFVGAVHESETVVSPAVAVRLVGADGTVSGVDDTVLDGGLVPTEFIAETTKSYDCPFVRPVTVAEVAVLIPSSNEIKVTPSEVYSIR